MLFRSTNTRASLRIGKSLLREVVRQDLPRNRAILSLLYFVQVDLSAAYFITDIAFDYFGEELVSHLIIWD